MNTQKINDLKQLTVTAIFMAMTIVLSMSIFSIPVPGGHLYFCDAIICTAALLLNPFLAFMVGGIAPFLGDFFFYPAAMFVSLLAHGLQAVSISFLSHIIKTKHPIITDVIALLIGSILMVVTYTYGRAYTYGTWETTIVKLPTEILQAVTGSVLAIILIYGFKLKTIYNKMFQD